MITFLSRLLIKEHTAYTSPRVRIAYGILCGTVGIIFNLLLFAGKLFAGGLVGSIAMTADAFNNLSDAGSSVVSLVGFRLSGQKADNEHPFGHGRIEYVAGLVVSMVILLMGYELLQTSVEKIIRPEPVTFSWLAVGILACSILVKLYMFLYNRSIGRKIASATMGATAMDSFSDVAATGVVLLSAFVGKWTGLAVDGYAGLGVALFILYTGIRSAKDTISPLLGEPPDQALVEKIQQLVLSEPDITGVHDLVVHSYGPGRTMVTLHAEVPADGNLLHLHDSVDNVEKKLRGMLGCQAVIHMDPVVTNDEETNHVKRMVEAIVRCIDPAITIHDFRMVAGPTHTNLVFDVAVPYSIPLSDEEVKRRIEDCIKELDDSYFAVIDVDKASIK